MSPSVLRRGPGIHVLIVDESTIWRAALAASLTDVKDISLLGAAPTAKTGLARAAHHQPDVIIVSTTLPDLSSTEFARLAIAQQPDGVGVLLAADPSSTGAAVDAVISTLEAGAFDFFTKPESAPDTTEQETFSRGVLSKIRAFSTARYSRKAKGLVPRRSHDWSTAATAKTDESSSRPSMPIQERADTLLRRRARRQGFEVVLLAVSTGGPETLKHLLPALPASFPLPIVVAIHLPATFTASLARSLNGRTALTVHEGTAGTALQAGHVYLGRGGEHLLIARDTRGRLILKTTDAPPKNGCRPSADILFRSAIKPCPTGVLALVMTGMGADSLEGIRDLRAKATCHVIAQDESSSIVWGMPGSIVRDDLHDEIVPLQDIPLRMLALVGRRG